MLSLKSNEQRRSPRYPLERLAKVQFTTGGKPHFFIVSDVSGGGVNFQSFGIEVPDEFVLTLAGGPAKDGNYRIVWRNKSEIGAKYIGPAVPDA
jgi:PilZ domain